VIATSAAARLPAILAALEEVYGRPEWRPTGEPLAELIQTILSQHTSDINSGRAYRSLMVRFPDFAAVRDAPHTAVADAIRSGGLADVKARTIQAALRALSVDGGPPALPDLAALPLDTARARLTDLPGVGPKTAACVLMFGLGLPAMPVDTHVHRVSRRLGLIPDRLSAEAAQPALEAITPPGDVYSLHICLIRHGRRVCRAPTPRCPACAVRELCPYPAKTLAVAPEETP
jgi:endonuclease-3